MQGLENKLLEINPYQRMWGPKPNYPLVQSYQPPDYGPGLITMAGPCSIESVEQIEIIAKELYRCNVKYLRGGIFRAGTYPSSKFGFTDELLMAEFSRAARDYGMKCVMEVLDYHPEALKLYDKYADAYQVGARQMQNYTLLRVLGKKKRIVFLKRNMGSTLDELLGAAEHLLRGGQCEPILVERGTSTFLDHVRHDLSISLIAAVKKITKIPIIVDASHGTGRRDLVEPMTLAGIAAGADGYMVETHYNPEKSLSDATQAYPLDEFYTLNAKALRIHDILKVPVTK